MRRFAALCEAIAATSRKSEKVRLLAEYLRSLAPPDAVRAAVFLTGLAFARREERVLAVGGSAIWQALTRVAKTEVRALYRKYGDLGSVAAEALQHHCPSKELTLEDVSAFFERLAKDRLPAAKIATLEEIFERSTALDAKYIVKIITSELRIGLKESLVEEAIAAAHDRPLASVRRANMLTGDIGATLQMALDDSLNSARLTPFRPIDCMLASPIESAAEAMAEFPAGALVEDKYDGIRAQAHKTPGRVEFFARTLNRIPEFPEIEPALAALPGDFVLDGEIVGWRDGRAIPFTELQQRLGRKHPELFLSLEIPASFVAFDLLYRNGESLLNAPLSERRGLLEALLSGADGSLLQMTPSRLSSTEASIESEFKSALARGNEGIVIKDPHSLYTPGRRGGAWLKWKQPLATLDVVITAVEYGHGKRHGVLSDYTFAVRDGERLLDIGKAYSGLTNDEIAAMTAYFLDHTIEDQGSRRAVEPTVVIEVAFNNIQRSARHASGYALRFPRIVRLRPDKPAKEIDTLDRVRELFSAAYQGSSLPR